MASQTLQAAFTGGEISPELWARVDFDKFFISLSKCWNSIIQPHGGTSKRPGFLFAGEISGPAALHQFLFSNEQSYVLCFGEKWLEVASKDGFFQVVDENEVSSRLHVESPYTYEQAKKLSIIQNKDILYIACAGQPPRKLTRKSNTEWEFSEIQFTSPLDGPDTVTAARDGTASPAKTDYSYFVSSIDENDLESEATESNVIVGPAAENWSVADGIKITWPVVDGAVRYNIYKSSFGSTPLYIANVAQPESATTATFRDVAMRGDVSKGIVTWENPFPNEDGSGNDFPSVVGIYEQRLVYTGIASDPDAVWFSRIGEYESFSSSNPFSSADAFKFALSSKSVSMPRWVVDLRSLVIGSDSIEWELSSSGGSGFSFTSAMRRISSAYGSSDTVRGMTVGSLILHVTRSRNVIRDLQYQFSNDTFGGLDRNILATHLLEGMTITDWTYQQTPDSVVWAVRDDGALLGFTFMLEQNIYAWHQHHTEGRFMHVLSMPDTNKDLLFAVTERAGKYFLEVQGDRYYSGDHAGYTFLDCSAIRTFEQPTNTVTGLDWLEGKAVSIMADGASFPLQTVTNGTVTLSGTSTAKTFVLGLPYLWELVSVPLEAGQSNVTKKKVMNAINLRVRNTMTIRGGILGRPDSEAQEPKLRTDEPFGSPPRLKNGDLRLGCTVGAGTQIQFRVFNEGPQPVTVLAWSPEFTISG